MARKAPTKHRAHSAAGDVVCSAVLLRHITSFQIGVQLALYAFWIQHDPNGPLTAARQHHLNGVIELVVKKGSVSLFAMLRDARIRVSKTEYIGDSTNRRTAVAIKRNRIDMVEWALTNATTSDSRGYKPWKWWKGAIKAYRPNDFRVLELIRTHLDIDDAVLQYSDCFIALSDNAEIRLLQWIHGNWPTAYAEDPTGSGKEFTWAKFLRCAIGRRDLTVVRFLVERISPSSVTVGDFDCALNCNSFEILEFLIENCVDSLEGIVACAKGIKLHVRMAGRPTRRVEALLWKYASVFRHGIAQLVGDRVCHNIATVREWYAAGKLAQAAPVSIDRLPNSCEQEHEAIEGIDFLQTIGLATATTDAMDNAAMASKWEVVDYLCKHRTEGCTSKTIDAAVKSGNLERVRFFHEHYNVDCTWEGTTNAAQYQPIAFVRYLHEHTISPFSTQAMDEAAYEGRLHVVKFLHLHRPEGCRKRAVDAAARRGHLDVVTFLLENRQEGFSPKVIKQVLHAGHVQVLNALYRHSPGLFRPDSLRELLVRGAFDIYMQLRERYPDKANAVVDEAMEDAGKKLELPTIRFILEVLNRKDLAYRAGDGAAWYNNMDWVRAVLAITGPESCRLSAIEKAITGRQERTRTFAEYNHTTPFLVKVCIDPNARKTATELGKVNEDENAHWLKMLKQKKAVERRPIHPLLLDPRTQSWAIRDILRDDEDNHDGAFDHYGTTTWAIRAICRRDLTLLEVLRDLRPSAVKTYCDTSVIGRCVESPSSFSFEGAREAAIRMGDLGILQWLLENVDLPIEPTLFSEAVYYNQYDIAEWLVETYPSACTKFDWSSKGTEKPSCDFGLRDGLLDWLDTHDAVRNLVPMAELVDFAARKNDMMSLRQLYARCPEHFAPRPLLLQLVNNNDCGNAIQFFSEIGYDLKAVQQTI